MVHAGTTRLMAQAESAMNRADLESAKGLLRQALAQDANNVNAAFQLARCFARERAWSEASKWFARTRALHPGHVAAIYNYGAMQVYLKNPDEAEQAYLGALTLDQRYLPALEGLASLYFQQHQVQKALQLVRQALQVDAASEKANLILARLLHQAGNLAEAEACYDRVLRDHPKNQTALLFKGNLVFARGHIEDSVDYYRRLLDLIPGNPEALYNLARSLHAVGREEEAASVYRSAIQHYCPDDDHRLAPSDREISDTSTGCATLRYNYGIVLKRLKQRAEWLENYRVLERIAPDALAVSQMGLSVARQNGDHRKEHDLLGRLITHAYRPGEADFLDLVLSNMLYHDVAQSDELRLYRQFDNLMMRRVAGRVLNGQASGAEGRSGRIRLGYLSADLCKHVMGAMMLEIIPRHDRERFEVFAYSLGHREDDVTQTLRMACDKFTSISGLGARAAAEAIARDDLDILVDLQTHTLGAKAEILAYKPARIQITHIASCGALGLSTIDYKLTDAYSDTQDNQDYLIEKLLPVEGCIYPFHRLAPPIDSVFKREDLGIDEQDVLIGAFVSIGKLSPRCMALWRRVLDAIPRAKLAFSPFSEADREHYVNVASAAGIAPGRYVFVPQGGGESENLARYALVDFVLDTMPYGSVNGAFEPLSMGVPIVTLLGKRHGERTVFSILSNLGVTDTVARTEDEFISIALRLAEDGDFSRELRGRIQAGMVDSPLVDMDSHVRNLEAAFLTAHAARTSPAT